MRFRLKYKRYLLNLLIITNDKLLIQQVINYSLDLLHRRIRYLLRNLIN